MRRTLSLSNNGEPFEDVGSVTHQEGKIAAQTTNVEFELIYGEAEDSLTVVTPYANIIMKRA